MTPNPKEERSRTDTQPTQEATPERLEASPEWLRETLANQEADTLTLRVQDDRIQFIAETDHGEMVFNFISERPEPEITFTDTGAFTTASRVTVDGINQDWEVPVDGVLELELPGLTAEAFDELTDCLNQADAENGGDA